MSLTELIFIGVGGIIGAGFFLGSGLPILQAGPSVLISFVIGGLITAQVVGALNSVALDHPVEGAFVTYAKMYLGSYLGFMQGWTYYVTSILTISSEAVASAIFVRVWMPSWPLWLLAAIFAFLVLLINAFGVKDFGVVESFMSVVKIAAILGFIVFVGVMFFGMHAATVGQVGVTHPHHGHAFFAHGFRGVIQSMLVVIFTFGGIGVFSTAAMQLKHPRQVDTGGIATVSILTVLYVLSVGGLLLVLPWYAMSTNISPFVLALKHLQLNGLADVLNAVILVAAFSVMAGAIFSANQILVSLGHRHEAPKFVARTAKKRPVQYGALGCTALGIGLFIALSSILPSNVYTFLVSASSFFTFFNWFIMLATFISWRRRNHEKRVSKLAFGRTGGSFITMAVLVVLTVYALFNAQQRFGFYACLAIFALVTLGYVWMRHKGKSDAMRTS